MRTVLLIVITFFSNAVMAADLDSRVDEYLSPYLETNNFQGVVLIAQGDEVLMANGYGMANVEQAAPNTPETVFHIASVSKPFTAAGIMLLFEEGKIDLNAPLSDVIPEYPQSGELTIHDLLAHTSGIPNINALEVYDEVQLHAQTPESLLEYFTDLPLQFDPGSQYSYSNSNYNLLALIIERVSEQSFGNYLGERVLAPAKTSSAAHDSDPTAIILNRADGYAPDGLFGIRRAPWLDWTAKTGNGSMIATAEDLFLWARAFFSDEIVTASSRAMMLSEHTTNVGYGWFITQSHERTRYHINGRSPGFSSFLGYYPDEDVTIVILSNLYNSITTSVGTDLAAMVFGVPYEVPKLSAEPLPASVAAGVPGRFQYGADFYNADVIVTLELRDGHVYQLWGETGFESALIPQGDDQFVDRAFWSDVAFARDENGVVVEVLFDGFTAHRIDGR